MKINRKISVFLLSLSLLLCFGCDGNIASKGKRTKSKLEKMFEPGKRKPRTSLFIGMDISGSFMQTRHFKDSLNFIAHYIYCHLRGLGGLEVPNTLFVGSIGGEKADEVKTFFPKQTFEDKSVGQIRAKLREIFPRSKPNPFTDYNAFFTQVAHTVKNKNLILRPVEVVMISDGVPSLIKKEGRRIGYSSLNLTPIEGLARSVSVRLLYTTAEIGQNWQTIVPRRNIKLWTQDAKVMVYWRDPDILIPGKPLHAQHKFFRWIKENVDFGVRARTVSRKS